LILFATKNNAQAIPANALCQIIGIAPTLIVVQVQAGLSEADRWYSNDNRNRRGVTDGPSKARTSYEGSSFGHGAGSAPIVISIDRPTVASFAQEIPEKESTIV